VLNSYNFGYLSIWHLKNHLAAAFTVSPIAIVSLAKSFTGSIEFIKLEFPEAGTPEVVYIVALPAGIIGHVSGTVQPAIETCVPSNVISIDKSPNNVEFITNEEDSPKNPIFLIHEYLLY
jgi:hypothetical protein